MRRAVALICAAMAGGGALQAQGLSKAPPRRDPAIEILVADAAIVPPEFSSDLLIRIASLPKVDQAWRRELLDDAYMRAYGAPQQYRLATNEQIPPDSRQGAEVFANVTALTRVTLQIRVVQLMAFVDRAHARDLFEWIDLNLAPGTCANPLVPSVDEYYTTLTLLARTAYRYRPDALNFFELYLWRAHLPSEMPAVARSIDRFRFGAIEAAYFEGLFRLLLQGSTTDPRGFSSADLDIISKSTELQIADTAMGVPGSNVLEAVRVYLLAQLKAPRCADNSTAVVTPSTFNAALRRAKAEFDVKPIDENAARLPTLLGTTHIDMYWQTAEAGRLHDAAARLRGTGAVALPLRVRQTVEWRNQAEALLIDVERWSAARESNERDYFYQKSVLYTWLLELMPQSVVRQRALRSFVEFLRRSETDVNQRALWFAFVNRLLEMASGPYRAEVLAAMEESHQPTLWVYARLERQAPERRP
ncbi:MAG TPA: hypothetical protein VKI43_06865 [Vicinamibacterales bacterium]|nr:hypothetical protein [Vicinamibacterales bacterium]